MTEMNLQELAAANPKEIIKVSLAPTNIDKFNKIIEAYDNLALVSTLDAAAGEVVLWVTEDMRPVALKLLTKLPFPVEIL